MAADMPTLDQIRDNVKESLRTLRQDHKRSLNPTPYKVTGKYMNSNENILLKYFFCAIKYFYYVIKYFLAVRWACRTSCTTSSTTCGWRTRR